mgnify:CR=1 FL=1
MGLFRLFPKRASIKFTKVESEAALSQAVRNETISHCFHAMEEVLAQYLEPTLTQRILDETRQRLV